MKKYQRLAQQIISQIELGVWLPGDKLPSLREQVASSGMSFMTVGHAYQMLESQGRIVARPQSGYYVASRPTTQQPAPPAQVMRDEAVDINTYIFDVLGDIQAHGSIILLQQSNPYPARITRRCCVDGQPVRHIGVGDAAERYRHRVKDVRITVLQFNRERNRCRFSFYIQ